MKAIISTGSSPWTTTKELKHSAFVQRSECQVTACLGKTYHWEKAAWEIMGLFFGGSRHGSLNIKLRKILFHSTLKSLDRAWTMPWTCSAASHLIVRDRGSFLSPPAPLTTPALGEQLRKPTWKRQLKERPRFSDNLEIQADWWEHGSVVMTDDGHVNRTLRTSVDGVTNPWDTNPRSLRPDAIQFNTTHRHFP